MISHRIWSPHTMLSSASSGRIAKAILFSSIELWNNTISNDSKQQDLNLGPFRHWPFTPNVRPPPALQRCYKITMITTWAIRMAPSDGLSESFLFTTILNLYAEETIFWSQFSAKAPDEVFLVVWTQEQLRDSNPRLHGCDCNEWCKSAFWVKMFLFIKKCLHKGVKLKNLIFFLKILLSLG